MKIQPRQELLEIWESAVRSSWVDDQWRWGGRDGPNSISDAEQMLTAADAAPLMLRQHVGVADQDNVLDRLAPHDAARPSHRSDAACTGTLR